MGSGTSIATWFLKKAVSNFIEKQKWNSAFSYAQRSVPAIGIELSKNVANHTYRIPFVEVSDEITGELLAGGVSEEDANKYLKALSEGSKKHIPLLSICLSLDQSEERLTKLEKEVTALGNALFFSQTNNIDDINNLLKEWSLKRKPVGLDFFDFQDPGFQAKLKTAIEAAEPGLVIEIVATYRKEAFYAVLQMLKQLYEQDYEQMVFAARSEDAVRSLQGHFPEGKILINGFFDDKDIPICSSAINIHILGRAAAAEDALVLQNRTYKAIEKALEIHFGFDSEQANAFLQRHGHVFPCYYPNLFSEASSQRNMRIVNALSPDVLAACLLFPKWSLDEKRNLDHAIIREFLRKPAEESLEHVFAPPQLQEDPLAKKTSSWVGQESMTTLGLRDAYDALFHRITEAQFRRFLALSERVLLNLPPAFSEERRIFVPILDYSDDFRFSLIEAMSLIRQRSNRLFNRETDSLIAKFAKWAGKDPQRNEYFGSLFDRLIEASPEKTLKKLEQDINGGDGLNSLFAPTKHNGDGRLFSTDPYPHVLWGLEKLLYKPEFRERAFRGLLSLYEPGRKYAFSNSPEETLRVFMLAWIRSTDATDEEKENFLNYAYECSCEKAWALNLKLVFTGHGGDAASILCAPRYLDYNPTDPAMPQNESRELYEFYDLALIRHAKTAEMWAEVVESHSFLMFGHKDEAFARIKEFCQSATDEERETIAQSLRYFVYNNRSFPDANWAFPETVIELVEKELLSSISFERKEWEFVHLYNGQSIAPPHPLPCLDSNEGLWHAREEIKHAFLVEQEDIFIRQKLSIDYLSSLLEKDAGFKDQDGAFFSFALRYEKELHNLPVEETAVKYIARFQDNHSFVMRAADCLYRKDEKAYYSVFTKIPEKTKPLYLKVALFDIESPQFKEALESLTPEEENIYWTDFRGYKPFAGNIASLDYALSKIKDLQGDSDQNSYAELLYYFWHHDENKGRIQLIYDRLAPLCEDLSFLSHSNAMYELQELVKLLQGAYFNVENEEAHSKIALLEMLFLSTPGFVPVFLNDALARDPKIYFSIAEKILFPSKATPAETAHYYSLVYLHLKFFPGQTKDGFLPDLFKTWMKEYEGLINETRRRDKKRVFYHSVGRLLASSPEDPNDLLLPMIAARDFIEGIPAHHFSVFSNSYSASLMNQSSKGLHSIDDGSHYRGLAREFASRASKLKKLGYQKTATLMEMVSDNYEYFATQERRAAEDDG